MPAGSLKAAQTSGCERIARRLAFPFNQCADATGFLRVAAASSGPTPAGQILDMATEKQLRAEPPKCGSCHDTVSELNICAAAPMLSKGRASATGRQLTTSDATAAHQGQEIARVLLGHKKARSTAGSDTPPAVACYSPIFHRMTLQPVRRP